MPYVSRHLGLFFLCLLPLPKVPHRHRQLLVCKNSRFANFVSTRAVCLCVWYSVLTWLMRQICIPLHARIFCTQWQYWTFQKLHSNVNHHSRMWGVPWNHRRWHQESLRNVHDKWIVESGRPLVLTTLLGSLAMGRSREERGWPGEAGSGRLWVCGYRYWKIRSVGKA